MRAAGLGEGSRDGAAGAQRGFDECFPHECGGGRGKAFVAWHRLKNWQLLMHIIKILCNLFLFFRVLYTDTEITSEEVRL